VQSSVGGRVAIIHVEENQNVTKGQLLLTLKNDAQKRQLDLSNLQIEISKNNVKDLETQLELTMMQIEISTNNVQDLVTNLKDIQRRLTDEQILYEQGSSTRSQLDAIKLEYNRGKLSLENSKLTLQRSKKEINRKQLALKNNQLSLERSKQDVALREETLEDTRLKAKITGIVTAIFFEEGEVIDPGAVLFQIINIEQVEIEVQVEEEDLPMVKKGQPVVFTTPSYRDKQFPGIIERISWSADSETGRFPLYVKAANPGLKLRAGMS
ncbi:uncharacterized protein METZ01_LOCUS327946, partial [marine metagenome]